MRAVLQFLGRGWLTLSYVALVPLWMAAFWHRANLVDQRYGALVDCTDCFQPTVFNADSPILIAAAALLFFGLVFRHWALALLCRLLLLLLTAVYVLDIYVYESFNSRLYASDIGRYFDLQVLGKYLQDNLTQVAYGWQLGVICVVMILCFVCFQLKGVPGKGVQYCTALLLIISGTGLWVEPASYVHNAAIDNVIALNGDGGEAQVYSDSLRRRLEQPVSDTTALECTKGNGTRPNIVLLIVESLSSWQSQHFSGLNDWTPRLDEIARNHQASTQFFANGFTTNEGLVAMLTGRQPIPAVTAFNAQSPFQNYWNLDRTLPKMLRTQGYQSLFLTSGNLDFSAKGLWLKNTGFDYIEGDDHPGYNGLTRFGFNSVADAAQYSRALELLTGDQQLQRFRPYWPGLLPITSQEQASAERYAQFPLDVDLLAHWAKGIGVIASQGLKPEFTQGALNISASNNDPALHFPSLELAQGRNYQLDVQLETPGSTTAQLFYKAGPDAQFTEAFSLTHDLASGENKFSWSFSIDRAPGEIRLDPGALAGDYRITQLRLRSQAKPKSNKARMDTLLASEKPYFMTIETVTTHHPYVDPMTMDRSARKTFEYADTTAGLFYDALRESDFFDNGMLIITSDHRSMTPLAKSELAKFGLSAKARIPLIVVAPMLQRQSFEQGRFQQRDLPASLLQLTQGENCRRTSQGNLFAQPAIPPRCVLHHRGDRRDYVDAFCEDQQGTIQLEGDDTRVISGDLKNGPKLIDAVNRRRIQGASNNRG